MLRWKHYIIFTVNRIYVTESFRKLITQANKMIPIDLIYDAFVDVDSDEFVQCSLHLSHYFLCKSHTTSPQNNAAYIHKLTHYCDITHTTVTSPQNNAAYIQ